MPSGCESKNGVNPNRVCQPSAHRAALAEPARLRLWIPVHTSSCGSLSGGERHALHRSASRKLTSWPDEAQGPVQFAVARRHGSRHRGLIPARPCGFSMHLRRNRRTARNGSQTFRLLSATVVLARPSRHVSFFLPNTRAYGLPPHGSSISAESDVFFGGSRDIHRHVMARTFSI